jgi:hypothetical protein
MAVPDVGDTEAEVKTATSAFLTLFFLASGSILLCADLVRLLIKLMKKPM